MTPTIYFDTLRYDLKSYHPVVVNIPLLQLLLVEVQDEGQVIVKIKLRKKGTRIRSLQKYKQTVFLIYVHRYLDMHKYTVLYQMCELKQTAQKLKRNAAPPNWKKWKVKFCSDKTALCCVRATYYSALTPGFFSEL